MKEQTILVAKDGSGDFSSLQEAIYHIPDERDYPVSIYIKPGIYHEKVFIRKENINIIGMDSSEIIIRYGDGAKTLRPDGSEYRTFNTATVLFAGKDIYVENITFENCAGSGHIVGQALAVYVASDRTVFKDCRFLGFQDTLFAGDINPTTIKSLMLPEEFLNSPVPIYYPHARNYFETCYIAGDVDFIFGPNTVYFARCEIFSKKLSSERVSFITAASTPPSQEYGFVFVDCKLTSDDAEASVYLGRPWRDYAKTAFIGCQLGNHIKPEGWHNWNKPKAEVTCSYVEYGSTGPGASTQRVNFSKLLDNPGVVDYYSLERVMSGHDQWKPIY